MMRIFVVSDTHGSTGEFLNKVNIMGKPDLIIHLGDYVEDGMKIERKTGIKTIIVKGNGDYLHSDYNEDETLSIRGKKIFVTHGHNYNVRYGIGNLVYKGQEANADLILFGHTHMSILIEEYDIMIMNPGSPSIPRGFTRKKTFGIIEIDESISGQIVEIN